LEFGKKETVMKKKRRVEVSEKYYYMVEYDADLKPVDVLPDVFIRISVYSLENGKPIYIKSYSGSSCKPMWIERLFGATYESKLRFHTSVIEEQALREINQLIYFDSVMDKEATRK
jgi:hypothetical protein